MNAALLISHAHWVLVVSKGGPHPPLPSSSTFSYPPDCADTYSRCFQKCLGSCEAKQACEAWKLCCWLCRSSFLIHSSPLLFPQPLSQLPFVVSMLRAHLCSYFKGHITFPMLCGVPVLYFSDSHFSYHFYNKY